MSWLEQRSSGMFHIVFRLSKERFKKSLKTTNRNVAEARQVRLEENLRLLEAGRLGIPQGADAAAFLLSDGKLNGKPPVGRVATLAGFCKGYFEDLPKGYMEENSLCTARIHMNHFERILGKRFPAGELKLADLQGYVRERAGECGRRQKRVSPSTIRKEMATFSAAWSWAVATGRGHRPCPRFVSKPGAEVP